MGFFVTTFNLDLPEDTDVPLSFVFDNDSTATTQPYRAILFVNGWMMGKRVANLGCVKPIAHGKTYRSDGICSPQTKFPVHEGILEYHGIK